MRRLAIALVVAGLLTVAVGLLGLQTHALRPLGVTFVFPVTPWYGPLFAGVALGGLGVLLLGDPPGTARLGASKETPP